MAMSRKHYIEMAKVLREARVMPPGELTVDYIAQEVAMMFARDNARFDLTRFMEATRTGARQTPRRVY